MTAFSDCELLELAAKAAGLIVVGYYVAPTPFCLVVHKGDGDTFRWNPLADDGDALRLAVKLRQRVDISAFSTAVSVRPKSAAFVLEQDAADPYAAARRAIVCAAATEPHCTCPSGDGSLGWPCPSHSSASASAASSGPDATIDSDEFKMLVQNLIYAHRRVPNNAKDSWKRLIAYIHARLAHQRQEGRRDAHETNIVLLGENDRLRDRLTRTAAPTEDQLRAEFERQHKGRNLLRHRLRGTYSSPPIAALWNQHKRTAEWCAALTTPPSA